MTTLILRTITPKMQALHARLSQACNSFATGRVLKFVSGGKQSRPQREIEPWPEGGHVKLDLSASRTYDRALDILHAYKLTGNFHAALKIVLKDLGAFDQVTFEIEPKFRRAYKPDCRRVVFRPNQTVRADAFAEILRTIDERIGLDATLPRWARLLHFH